LSQLELSAGQAESLSGGFECWSMLFDRAALPLVCEHWDDWPAILIGDLRVSGGMLYCLACLPAAGLVGFLITVRLTFSDRVAACQRQVQPPLTLTPSAIYLSDLTKLGRHCTHGRRCAVLWLPGLRHVVRPTNTQPFYILPSRVFVALMNCVMQQPDQLPHCNSVGLPGLLVRTA
jgi:hypothetical protein